MNEANFFRSVADSRILLQLRKSTIAVSVTPITGCCYSFYLYKNNLIIHKLICRKKPSVEIPIKGLREGDRLKVKVLYINDICKTSKISKSITLPRRNQLGYSFDFSNVPTLSLQDCEISYYQESKIIEHETIGFKPRSDCLPIKLRPPINWLEDPFNDRNWMFQLHAWRNLDPYFNRLKFSDVTIIQEVINDWVGYEKKHKNKWFWYDMSTGLRALKISFYLQQCYKHNIEHGLSDLDYLLGEHIRHLSNPGELSSGNHGLFQLHGLKSLIFILKEFENGLLTKDILISYSNNEMEKLILRQLGRHGVHTEDSPDYHFFAHKKITGITKAPWWLDLNQEIIDLLNLGEHAKAWLVYPDSRCVPVGDSSSVIKRSISSCLTDWPHESFEDYVGAQIDGYAVIRSNNNVPIKGSSFLFLQGSFYNSSHKHCDDLSIILQEGGKNILIDPGKYGYNQDRFRKYFISTPAHNTITVDGISTTRLNQYSYGSAIQEPPRCHNGLWSVKAYVDHIVNQYSHQRILFYLPGIDMYVVDIIDNKSHTSNREVSLWWHFDTDAIFTRILDGKLSFVDLDISSKPLHIRTSSCADDIQVETFKGHDEDCLAGWVSKSYLGYQPSPCVRLISSLNKTKVFITHFTLSQGLSTPLIQFKGNLLVSHNAYVIKQLPSEVRCLAWP